MDPYLPELNDSIENKYFSVDKEIAAFLKRIDLESVDANIFKDEMNIDYTDPNAYSVKQKDIARGFMTYEVCLADAINKYYNDCLPANMLEYFIKFLNQRDTVNILSEYIGLSELCRINNTYFKLKYPNYDVFKIDKNEVSDLQTTTKPIYIDDVDVLCDNFYLFIHNIHKTVKDKGVNTFLCNNVIPYIAYFDFKKFCYENTLESVAIASMIHKRIENDRFASIDIKKYTDKNYLLLKDKRPLHSYYTFADGKLLGVQSGERGKHCHADSLCFTLINLLNKAAM